MANLGACSCAAVSTIGVADTVSVNKGWATIKVGCFIAQDNARGQGSCSSGNTMPAWLGTEAKAARTKISGDCIHMERVVEGRRGRVYGFCRLLVCFQLMTQQCSKWWHVVPIMLPVVLSSATPIAQARQGRA